jgi:hypothetical protein
MHRHIADIASRKQAQAKDSTKLEWVSKEKEIWKIEQQIRETQFQQIIKVYKIPQQ